MNEVLLLGRRTLREALRLPEATIPALFIPLFFLVVNVGQVSKTFGRSTPFLHGQSYAAFQLPVSLMFAVSGGVAGLALVQDIELGYFDKLRVTPIRRTSLVFGRLGAEFVKGLLLATMVSLISFAFGISIAAGPLGFVVIVLITSLWGVIFAGFGQVVALRTRSASATNASQLVFFPLLFLTPNFVPRHLLTHWMEILASVNPVTYIIEAIRSLILEGFRLGPLLACLGVLLGVGALMIGLNVAAINKPAD